MHNYVKQMWILSFKNWKINTLSSKSIQTEEAKFSDFDRMRGDKSQIFRTCIWLEKKPSLLTLFDKSKWMGSNLMLT